jgi:hypothetical protein
MEDSRIVIPACAGMTMRCVEACAARYGDTPLKDAP